MKRTINQGGPLPSLTTQAAIKKRLAQRQAAHARNMELNFQLATERAKRRHERFRLERAKVEGK